MPNSFWLKNNKLIIDTSGHPILCDRCPCGECPDIPVGSVIELEYSRTITRTKTMASATQSPRGKWENQQTLSVSCVDSISMAYAIDSAIPYHDPYRTGEDGLVRIMDAGATKTRTVSGSGSVKVLYLGDPEVETIYEPYALSVAYPVTIKRSAASGSCAWVPSYFFGDENIPIKGKTIGAENIGNIYDFRRVSGAWDGLNSEPLLPNSYVPDYGTYTRTASGLLVPLTDASDYFRPLLECETVSVWEGSVSASVEIDASFSYDHYDSWTEERDYGSGTEHLEYSMTCHWLITPPTTLGCVNCGL